MSESILGPVLAATLTTTHVDACVTAWCEHLHQRVHSDGVVSEALAAAWQRPLLAGARQVWLANALGEPWLRLLGSDDAVPVKPFEHAGWLSLEINVEDVDALHEALLDSPFTILGAPADLDISPDIRAMQVVGPTGEVLYLTQIKRDVPGFDLPLARCAVDKIFIPVLLAQSRDRALQTFEQFPGTVGNRFDTRITVINRARGLPLETRHPIATLQLRGQSLIEIDELDGLSPRPRSMHDLPTGISLISFAMRNGDALPDGCLAYRLQDGPFSGHRGYLMEGAAGELIELLL